MDRWMVMVIVVPKPGKCRENIGEVDVCRNVWYICVYLTIEVYIYVCMVCTDICLVCIYVCILDIFCT